MKLGTWTLAVLLLTPVVALAAAPADAPPAKEKDKDKDKDKEKDEAARVRYARTYLALAKLDVQIANDRNKQMPETLPPAIMLILEQRVALAEQWLKEARADGDAKPGDIAVRIAEIYLKAAEINFAKAQQVNRISPMRPKALERVRLKVDLAKAALASVKEIDPSSLETLLQFQIDRLREEVADMNVRQLELLDRN